MVIVVQPGLGIEVLARQYSDLFILTLQTVITQNNEMADFQRTLNKVIVISKKYQGIINNYRFF